MFKKILVAVDSSEHSVRAASFALSLARKFNSAVVLLHVIYLSGMYYAADFYSYTYAITENQLELLGERALQQVLAKIDVGTVDVSTKIATGHPATEILAESAKGYDLIVMGTRGHTPLTGSLVGSVTQQVLGKSACPVLVVKKTILN